MANSTASGRPLRLGVAWGILTAVVVLAFPVFAWVGHSRSGAAGVWAAVAAGTVCWLGATLALWLTSRPVEPVLAVSRTLLGMLPRMGLPLVAGAILDQVGGPLSEAGVFGMIVGYYFLTLVVETGLAMRLVARPGIRQ